MRSLYLSKPTYGTHFWWYVAHSCRAEGVPHYVSSDPTVIFCQPYPLTTSSPYCTGETANGVRPQHRMSSVQKRLIPQFYILLKLYDLFSYVKSVWCLLAYESFSRCITWSPTSWISFQWVVQSTLSNVICPTIHHTTRPLQLNTFTCGVNGMYLIKRWKIRSCLNGNRRNSYIGTVPPYAA